MAILSRFPRRALIPAFALLLCAGATCAASSPAAPVAFPGAEGFGALATGGRGGQFTM